MNIFFYIPYTYICKTRLTAKGRLVSFILILILPPLYVALFLQSTFTFVHLLEALLGLLLIQNLYEVGYIQNDTETIKSENKPTLRLDNVAINYYEANKVSIYASRILIALFISLILLFLTHFSLNTVLFLIIAYLLIPLYLIYNFIRNLGNLFLHFVLNVIKYTAIQILFLDTLSIKVFILSIFAFPVINFIDRAASPRFFYKFSNIYKYTEFRVYYYFLLTLFCGCFFLFNYINFYEFVLILYYFIYRSVIKIAVLCGKHIESK